MRTKPCQQCQGETEVSIIDTGEGKADVLTVAIRNMPVATCNQGHRQFVDPSFAARLLDHLTREDEPGLPSGEEKGLFRKHYLCEDCGAELEAHADHRHTFAVDVELPSLDAFQVELTMPVYRCSGCGKDQIHCLGDIRKHTPAALAHAFQSADIPPG